MIAASNKLPRLPFVLLGLMTAFSFGGPLAIGFVLKGGASANWPPDRSIEWIVFVGVSGMVVGLMLACGSLALTTRKAIKSTAQGQADRPGVKP
jgi:hypothetical protein